MSRYWARARFCVLGLKGPIVYVAGLGFIVFVFAILMAFGIVPFTALVVGLLIAGLCLGFAAPVLIKTA
jgi:hypothetical protein